MRFMVMHKMTEEMEKGGPPPQSIIEGVGKLIGEAVRNRSFVSGEGLKPSSQRDLIVYKDGQRTVTRGPFSDLEELVAGFALLRVRSKEEALSWCDKLAAARGDVKLVLGPVNEAWDLGMAPKPDNAPLRFLSLFMADERSEREASPDPESAAKLSAVIDEMTKAGVLQASGGLASTRKGARIRFEGGKRRVIDGPFAESKELVAGYMIVDLPSKAEAIEWAMRFGDVVKVNEIDVRQLAE